MAVVAIFPLPSPFILLTLLIKMRRCFYFVKLKIIPPVNPKFFSPDNDLRYVEGKEEGEKRGNRKTGKHGCQLAEVWNGRGALNPSFSGRGRTPLPRREREIVEC